MHSKIFSLDFIKIIFVSLCLQTANQITMTSLPLYIQSLQYDSSLLGIATALSSLAALLFRPISGRLADHSSRRVALAIGMICMAATMAGFALLPFAGAIIALRFLQGAGYSAVSTAQIAVATDVLPLRGVQNGLSYFNITTAIAGAAGPAIGFALISGTNYMPSWFTGAAIFAVGIVISMTFTYERSDAYKNAKKSAIAATGDGKGVWRYFEKQAMLPSALHAVLMLAGSGIFVFLPTYAVSVGVTDLNIFYTLQAIAMFLANVFIGNILRRVRNPYPILIPSILCFTGALLALFTATDITSFAIAGFCYGAGYGVCITVVSVITMLGIPEHRRGAASATYQCAGDLGYCIGPLSWGFLLSLVGYRSFYAVLLVLPLISFVLCFFAWRRTNKRLKAQND